MKTRLSGAGVGTFALLWAVTVGTEQDRGGGAGRRKPQHTNKAGHVDPLHTQITRSIWGRTRTPSRSRGVPHGAQEQESTQGKRKRNPVDVDPRMRCAGCVIDARSGPASV